MNAALLLALLSAGALATGDPYRARSGKAEAASDVKSGKPLSLYWQHISARSPVEQLPGISQCLVSRYKISTPIIFLEIPEADWQEGVMYNVDQEERQQSAIRFAADYNRAMFKAKRAEVIAWCPSAVLAR